MPVNFPNSPSDNQTFSSSGRVYKYNTTKGTWKKIAAPATTVTDVSDLTDTGGLLGGDGVTTGKAIAMAIVFGG
jgi:hypothetical protein